MKPNPDRQLLNPLDVALRCIDHAIRGMGFPGFETQMLVALAERVDVPRLRNALTRFGRRHPVVTARLVEDEGRHPSFWQFRPGAIPQLPEIELSSAEPSAVLAAAANLLSTPQDPAAADPLRFHLLHRPGGGDVLVIQYNHTLIDNSATALIVREIDGLSQTGGTAEQDQPHFEPRFLIGNYLRHVPHADRRAAAQAAIELQAHIIRSRGALLGRGEKNVTRPTRLKVAARVAEPELTRAIRGRAAELCGLPSLSMAMLGSAFRGIRALGSPEHNTGRHYNAGIGLDLDLREESGALLQNLLSLVAIYARGDELADRDGLVRSLSLQMRDRLVRRLDLGIVRLVHVFHRRPRYVSWVMGHLLRWSCSVWYAYFGALDSVGPRFCGVPVERVQYIGPTWSPKGIALLVDQFAGRLYLQLTFDPELVAEPLANTYLDWLMGDLEEFAAASPPRSL